MTLTMTRITHHTPAIAEYAYSTLDWHDEYLDLLRAQAICEAAHDAICALEREYHLPITPARIMVYNASRHCAKLANDVMRNH